MQYIKKILLPIVKLVSLVVLSYVTISFFIGFWFGEVTEEQVNTICFLTFAIDFVAILFYKPLRNSIFKSEDIVKEGFKIVKILGLYLLLSIFEHAG